MTRFFGGILLLFFMAGCGSQDRYDVLDPGQRLVDDNGPFALAHPVAGPWFNFHDPRPALIAGQVYYLNNYTSIAAYHEEGATLLPPLPEGTDTLSGMAGGPNGEVWAVERYDGGIYRFDGTDWTQDVSLPGGPNLKGVLMDGQERMLVYGYETGAWRRSPEGTWEQQDFPGVENLVGGYVDPHQGTAIFLGDRLEVITATADGWTIEPPLLEGPTGHLAYLEMDEEGRRAILWGGERYLYVDDGSGWELYPVDQNPRTFFWWEGNLIGYLSWDGNLCRFREGSWEHWLDLPMDYFPWDNVPAFDFEGGKILFGSQGEAWRLEGDEVSPYLPAVGDLAGLVRQDDVMLALTQTGLLMAQEDGSWSWKTWLPESWDPLPNGQALFLDEQGELVMVAQEGLATLDAQGEPLIQSVDVTMQGAYQQNDGSLLLTNQEAILARRGGQLLEISPYPGSIWGLRHAVLDSDDRLLLCYSDRITQLEDGVETPLGFLVGADVRGMIDSSRHGVLIYGDGLLMQLDGGTGLDLVPFFLRGQDLLPARLIKAVVDPQGRLVFLDFRTDQILLLDGDEWRVLEAEEWMAAGEPTSLTLGRDGSIFLYGNGHALCLEGGSW